MNTNVKTRYFYLNVNSPPAVKSKTDDNVHDD